MVGRDAYRVGGGGKIGPVRGLLSPGLGRGSGSDRGQGRGTDFGKIRPDPGVIAA